MNALVTGSRAPVAVLMARALHRAGFGVYTADSVTPTLGQFSRFVVRELPLPPARGNSVRYAESLERYIDRFQIAEIHPTSEEIFHLAQPVVRARLEAAGAKLCAAPLEILAKFHSKHEFARFAALLGLDVPETRRLTQPADWGGLDYARDGILKREFSRFGLGVIPLFGSWNERQQTAMTAVEKSGASGWIWQRWIQGAALSSYAYCVGGAVRAFCAYRVPYRTGTLGAGVYYEPIDAPELLEATQKLAEATDYTGHLALDAMRDAETGTLYLVECNPRATMGLALLMEQDGFPDFLHSGDGSTSAHLRQETVTSVEPYSEAVQSFFGNLLYGWKYRDRDRNLSRWLREICRTPDALNQTEPRFWWAQLYTLMRYANQAQRAGLTLFAFATHDIEWNGEGSEFAPSEATPETYRPPLLSFRNWNEKHPIEEPPSAERLSPQERAATPLPPVRRPALFVAFPELEAHLPWSPLLHPTPPSVERLTLPEATADLWVKRDDLCDARYGGNKARKFEWILGDLLAAERREMVTFGGLCSNHCLAAAIYGQVAGVHTRLCFLPTPLTEEERDLLYLQALLGAEQEMLTPEMAVELLSESSRATGPYVVPPGGSSRVGILGYVDAGLEFATQIRQGAAPRPDRIYIASASRGTVLGLAMGLCLSGLHPIPHLVPVETVSPLWQQTRLPLAAAHRKTYDLLYSRIPDARGLLPDFDALVPPGDTRFQHLEPGETNPELTAALDLARTIPALHLDAHFCGKAFAVLLSDLRAGRLEGKTVLFWQTHGRVPAEKVQEARRLRESGALSLPAEVEAAVQQRFS